MRAVANWLAFFLIFALLCGCDSTNTQFEKDHKIWQKERFDELKKFDGWPAVIGLFWLNEGVQFFGSSKESSEIIWPESLPSTIGRFDLEGDSVVMRAYSNLGLLINGENSSSVRMVPDTEVAKTIVNWRNYYWYLLKRQNKYGVRLIDTLSERRMNLKPIPSFPAESKWIVEAQYIAPDSGATVQYKNIVGMEFDVSFEGYLRFKIDDEDYELIALQGGEDDYFIIISDETTGHSTYGGGRYIYPKKADEKGKTIIDFNKLINPPCVFTDYATCPLPPKENHVAIKLTAGEKMPDIDH